MIIKIYGTDYTCEKAVKGIDFVNLYGQDDKIIATFNGISSFDDYVIEDGDWFTPPQTLSQQIQSLKDSLSSTDYKIIKCSEAQLLGEELPYDIASLHAERQALRDKINELEQQLEAKEEGGAI